MQKGHVNFHSGIILIFIAWDCIIICQKVSLTRIMSLSKKIMWYLDVWIVFGDIIPSWFTKSVTKVILMIIYLGNSSFIKMCISVTILHGNELIHGRPKLLALACLKWDLLLSW